MTALACQYRLMQETACQSGPIHATAQSAHVLMMDVGCWTADLCVGQVDLGRSLRLWLDLQAAVNGLLDSSTVPESGSQVRLP